MEHFKHLKLQIADLNFKNNLDCLTLRLLMLDSYGELIRAYNRCRKEDVPILITTGRELQRLYQVFTECIRAGKGLRQKFEQTRKEAMICLDYLISVSQQREAA